MLSASSYINSIFLVAGCAGSSLLCRSLSSYLARLLLLRSIGSNALRSGAQQVRLRWRLGCSGACGILLTSGPQAPFLIASISQVPRSLAVFREVGPRTMGKS